MNTSIRPGWFWHKSENDKVRPLDELINIYYNSVGANATFLLNIPPTNEGLFHKNDVKRLAEIGEYLRKAFAENIISQADVSYNGSDIKSKILADSYDDFFIPDTVAAVITVKWDAPESIGNIILKENITKSQRVEHFEIEALINGSFKKIYENTVIGYKRIIRLDNLKTDCLRINITDSRTEPTISFIGIYKGE